VDTPDKAQFLLQIRDCALDLGRYGVDALGPLYDLTATRLVRYALTLTRNQDDAEDALQAAMVRIALRPRALAGAMQPWAYFLRIVRNEALNITRRKRPAQLLEAWLAADGAEALPGEEWELKQTVQGALRKLPPAQCEVVVLKVWEEMTFAEIAQVLGESPNTVASRYRYALEKLTGHLQPLCDEVLYDR
jgi:RNA polymerase sigma-70 factor, ECF subfamily